MIFVNFRELTKHDINVHVDKLYQCQSCNQILVDEDDFNRHISKLHGGSPSTADSITWHTNNEEGTEPAILKKVTKEKKARRRIRGPYRKSQCVYNIKKQ